MRCLGGVVAAVFILACGATLAAAAIAVMLR
jgi:hypothetical protein